MLTSQLPTTIALLAASMVLLPLFAFVLVALCDYAGRSLSDEALARVAKTTFGLSSLAGVVATAVFVAEGFRPVHTVFGHWFQLGDAGKHGYGFDLGVYVDGVALTYLGLTAVLCGTVAAFSLRYMHGERGVGRFMQLLMLFASSLSLLAAADSLELLFVGWELVGISSALLIAFYRERTAPIRHGLVAFGVYRFCDAALLIGIVVLHHSTGSTDLTADGLNTSALATLFGGLMLTASMGKSAQWPFSSWLPRAMEGPTPSSAIFYGALSIHAGAFLLLRTESLWRPAHPVGAAIVVVGLVTAAIGTLVGRAQTDAKSALAYAAIVQVGIIYAEIGAGFDTLALLHLAGHATLRTLEFLRAPSVLADRQILEARLGRRAPPTGRHYEKWVSPALRLRLYAFALERGFVDSMAERVMRALARVTLTLDAFDTRVSRAFGPSDESQSPGPEHAESEFEMAFEHQSDVTPEPKESVR